MLNQDLYAKYLEFNKKYFDNKLPFDVKVVWDNRLVASAGSYNWSWGNTNKTIKLSPHYIKKFPEELDNILLHEMIHASGIRGHGERFKKEMRRINSFGWNVQTHSKERAVTHTYVCKQCKQTIKRSRRINVERYVCGKCGGKLTLKKEVA